MKDFTPDKIDEIRPMYQPLVDELKANKRRLRHLDLQANILADRLRKIQKNFYDDMTVIDTRTPLSTPSSRPWHSQTEFTRSKYKYWEISNHWVKVKPPSLVEIAIRKDGNEKQIATLDAICARYKLLDQMASKIVMRDREIKEELNDKYGQWVVNTELGDEER